MCILESTLKLKQLGNEYQEEIEKTKIAKKEHLKILANHYWGLNLHYEVEAQCDDCGEDIEECRYTNAKGEPVHVTTSTNGHYYSDGSVACDACHDASR